MKSNGFDTIGSLRCIDIDDLKQMFQQANIQLLLGRRRQLQNALKNLKDISPNNFQMGLQKPSFNNIVESSKESVKKIQRKLTLAEAVYSTIILSEREKDGRRCTNCHKTGHKADNNKNNKSCTNYPCASIHLCGQADKHPEYLQEKKTKQREILQLKQKIRKLDEENNQLESFMGVKKTDFMSLMRSSLRQTNPTKYQDGAKLMKDRI
ncbi:Hypothetical predicted protein [Mytilus galloprovincialis]|uniref:Uncharacterized protein n=1 Tax=Mytilus galloprovincialis TaxID=29158 RepID=A0A8B6F2E6_MYTGA|nr:Hypothetical predicted protein [Mytilus galloprovincialis]